MARRPLRLDHPRTVIGIAPPTAFPTLAAAAPPVSPEISERQTPEQRRAGFAGMSDAFDAGITGPLHGGGLGEGLARFGEAYFRTKDASGRRLDEEQERLNERTREEARRNALANAVQGYDASQTPQVNMDAMIRALGGAAPEEAIGLLGQDVQGRLGVDRGREQHAWERSYDNANPQAITPAQQAQFDLTRRGQNMDYQAQMARAQESQSRISPQDATRLSSISDDARTARDIQGAMRRFRALNSREGTGQLSGLFPSNIVGRPGTTRSEMISITDYLVPRLNAAVRLPGAASERDAQRLTSSAPNVGRNADANDAIIAGYEQATQNAIDYSVFAEQYALGSGRGLLGVDTEWNTYLELNPIYDSAGNVRTDRPNFQRWLSMRGPDMSSEISSEGAMQGAGISDDDVRAALQRGPTVGTAQRRLNPPRPTIGDRQRDLSGGFR